jgi:NAD(P)-dependent dehydrogenase (short-subunit alcohol dehydrogenase family)
LIALPFQGFYCAPKYALEALTESLRMEVKPYAVRVTLIEPGDFRTRISANRVIAAASTEASEYTVRQQAAVDVIIRNEHNGADPQKAGCAVGQYHWPEASKAPLSGRHVFPEGGRLDEAHSSRSIF